MENDFTPSSTFLLLSKSADKELQRTCFMDCYKHTPVLQQPRTTLGLKAVQIKGLPTKDHLCITMNKTAGTTDSANIQQIFAYFSVGSFLLSSIKVGWDHREKKGKKVLKPTHALPQSLSNFFFFFFFNVILIQPFSIRWFLFKIELRAWNKVIYSMCLGFSVWSTAWLICNLNRRDVELILAIHFSF